MYKAGQIRVVRPKQETPGQGWEVEGALISEEPQQAGCGISLSLSLIESESVGCSVVSHSLHGLQPTRLQEWVAIPFSRQSSQSRDRTQVSRTAGRFFTV